MESKAHSPTVIEQIREIGNNQLESGYFRKRMAAGNVKDAMVKRINRDDRVLLLAYPDETITEVNDLEALNRSDRIIGFAFFGVYTAEEMEKTMVDPLEEVYSREDFPAAKFRNITLREEAQGGSIASKMFGRAIEELYNLDQDVWIVYLLNRPGTKTPEYVEDFGAELVKEYGEYYDDWECTFCDSECECTFMYYRMEVT